MKAKGLKKMLVGVLAASMVLSTGSAVLASGHAEDAVQDMADSSMEVLNASTEWKYLDNGTDPADNTVAKDKWGQYVGWTRKYGTNENSSSEFNDGAWESKAGVFDTSDDSLNKESPAYFFRAYFDVENSSDIYGLNLNFDYKDAVIVYLNGQQLTSQNVPDAGYKTEDTGSGSHKDNLGYGSEKILETKKNADITLRDINEMLVTGQNVLAVELHKSSAESQAYFKMNALTLNPDESTLPEREAQKAVSLTIGSNPSELNVTWYSLDNSNGQVQIAKKSDMDSNEFPEDKAAVFPAVKTMTQGGIYTSNQATMRGLEENTEYVYRVGNNGVWSDIYTTNTKSQGAFSFIFAGDPQLGSSGDLTGDKDGWSNTLSLIQNNPIFSDVNFIQNAGDHVEASKSEIQYDAYLSNYEGSLIYSMPFATAVGNHDNKGTAYNTHFKLPNVSDLGNGGDGNADGDYYYTYNNSLFMVLNSNNRSTAEHKEFMKQAIEVNQDADWKIVIFHHSIYSTASHAVDRDILERRETLAPAFKELGVDAVLMGHDHVYTRSYMMDGLEPMKEVSLDSGGNPLSEITDPEGILYITANSASGSKYYEFSDTLQGDYVAVKNQEHIANISKIDISEGSFKITTYRTTDASVIDEFTIKKTVENEDDTNNNNGNDDKNNGSIDNNNGNNQNGNNSNDGSDTDSSDHSNANSSTNNNNNDSVQQQGVWKLNSKGWWYEYADGTYLSNQWKMIDGIWYVFDASGYMRTGWFDENGTWYYLNGSGAMQTGWLLDGTDWYYLNESGAMQMDGWLLVNGVWYYLNKSGAMQTGWLDKNDIWYYLDGSGAMQTGWLLDGADWYYLNESGTMQMGWLLYGDNWYYLSEDGSMLSGTSKRVNGIRYYFDQQGQMQG